MAVEITLGTVAGMISFVVAMELAQFGYLWTMNSRTIRNEARSKDNEKAIQEINQRRGKAD